MTCCNLNECAKGVEEANRFRPRLCTLYTLWVSLLSFVFVPNKLAHFLEDLVRSYQDWLRLCDMDVLSVTGALDPAMSMIL
jgi:hypothetical protein